GGSGSGVGDHGGGDEGGNGGCGVEVMEAGRRVVESDIGDRLDRVMGSIFGIGRKTRRKTFSATAGGRRLAGDGGGRLTGGWGG
nr:hypothetical protein [Tanacetum cinerariifolium]